MYLRLIFYTLFVAPTLNYNRFGFCLRVFEEIFRVEGVVESLEMSELISEKDVCRIVVEDTDKDDYWLDAESDVELFEILSAEDSDGDEDKYKECENRRDLKRKNNEKDENEEPR